MARFDVQKAAAKRPDAPAENAPEQHTEPTPNAAQKRTQRAPRKSAGADTPSAPKRSAKRGKSTPAKPARGAAATSTDTPETDDHRLRHRVHVPLPEGLFRDLARARGEDDIDTTVRIRALIELWHTDPQLRRQADKLAQQRSDELIRHRRPTE